MRARVRGDVENYFRAYQSPAAAVYFLLSLRRPRARAHKTAALLCAFWRGGGAAADRIESPQRPLVLSTPGVRAFTVQKRRARRRTALLRCRRLSSSSAVSDFFVVF